jgi:hypothetical protein
MDVTRRDRLVIELQFRPGTVLESTRPLPDLLR